MIVIKSGNIYRLYQAFVNHYTLNDLVHGKKGYLSEQANERSRYIQTAVEREDKFTRECQEMIQRWIAIGNSARGDGTDLDRVFKYQQWIDQSNAFTGNIMGYMEWVEDNTKNLDIDRASKHSKGMAFDDFKNNILVPLCKICKEEDAESYQAISGVSTSFSEQEKNGLFHLIIQSAPIRKRGQE